ncbi:hypothetical protein F5Y17DRAFT_332328 [Xylariaceae sp. FL0594]|nr:hypothetical protein F5Y17DRAFT_332328 [Xylariaceae sp. FL0594]
MYGKGLVRTGLDWTGACTINPINSTHTSKHHISHTLALSPNSLTTHVHSQTRHLHLNRPRLFRQGIDISHTSTSPIRHHHHAARVFDIADDLLEDGDEVLDLGPLPPHVVEQVRVVRLHRLQLRVQLRPLLRQVRRQVGVQHVFGREHVWAVFLFLCRELVEGEKKDR